MGQWDTFYNVRQGLKKLKVMRTTNKTHTHKTGTARMPTNGADGRSGSNGKRGNTESRRGSARGGTDARYFARVSREGQKKQKQHRQIGGRKQKNK